MQTKTRETGEALADELSHRATEKAGEMIDRAKAAGTAAWDKVNDVYGTARDKAVRSARVADQRIREKPYQAIGIAFGVGLLLGFLIKRSRSSNSD